MFFFFGHQLMTWKFYLKAFVLGVGLGGGVVRVLISEGRVAFTTVVCKIVPAFQIKSPAFFFGISQVKESHFLFGT